MGSVKTNAKIALMNEILKNLFATTSACICFCARFTYLMVFQSSPVGNSGVSRLERLAGVRELVARCAAVTGSEILISRRSLLQDVLGMSRSGAMQRITLVVLLIALIGAGTGTLYYYTLPTNPGTSAPQAGSGALTQYLGYLPSGYKLAPLLPNAPRFQCPSYMNSSLCATFKASCGNGVCDPNERCDTCPLDCGVPQGLACDPYTGRASGVGGVCMVAVPYVNTQPNGNPNDQRNPPPVGGNPNG
jgi:hypothetical protein